ncbi:hypothetical protein C5E11_00755 [Clavibacter michiganensis]|nr:hypothetical protein C5E11_00755 [Clavibacter michiganensis]
MSYKGRQPFGADDDRGDAFFSDVGADGSEWPAIKGLSRAGERPPEDGVNFAVIMTIEDPSGEAPAFDEMRASLTNIGVRLTDLRTRVNVNASV